MDRDELFDDEFLKRLQRLGLIAKRVSAAAASAGKRRSRRLGDGLEFADHRDYHAGDDIRFVDWPYFARMEKLLLRLFHEHSEGTVTILLDASRSMALGRVCKFDYARRAAAALAYVSMAGLDRVILTPFAGASAEGFATGRNRGQILQVLDFLSTLKAEGPTGLEAAAREYARTSAGAGTVMVLTDAIDVEEQLPRALAVLRSRRNDVILLHIIDPADAEPDILGPVQLAAVEGGGRMPVGVGDALLVSYRRCWREFVARVERACLAHRALYVAGPTGRPFDELVLETAEKAGVLQS